MTICRYDYSIRIRYQLMVLKYLQSREMPPRRRISQRVAPLVHSTACTQYTRNAAWQDDRPMCRSFACIAVRSDKPGARCVAHARSRTSAAGSAWLSRATGSDRRSNDKRGASFGSRVKSEENGVDTRICFQRSELEGGVWLRLPEVSPQSIFFNFVKCNLI